MIFFFFLKKGKFEITLKIFMLKSKEKACKNGTKVVQGLFHYFCYSLKVKRKES